jgi:hypothetical protein
MAASTPKPLSTIILVRERRRAQGGLSPFSRKPAFGYRSKGRVLADLRRFDHRVPKQTNSKGPCGLCKFTLDIAQAQ